MTGWEWIAEAKPTDNWFTTTPMGVVKVAEDNRATWEKVADGDILAVDDVLLEWELVADPSRVVAIGDFCFEMLLGMIFTQSGLSIGDSEFLLDHAKWLRNQRATLAESSSATIGDVTASGVAFSFYDTAHAFKRWTKIGLDSVSYAQAAVHLLECYIGKVDNKAWCDLIVRLKSLCGLPADPLLGLFRRNGRL